jgi:hypothetical protein
LPRTRSIAVQLCATAVLTLLTLPTPASVISQDWHQPNDGRLTLDPTTGFQWLDLSVTRGLSWNTTQTMLAPGGTLFDFRRPNYAEIIEFWSDAGIPDIEMPALFRPTAANHAPVAALQAIWGDTGPWPFTTNPTFVPTWVTTADSYDPVDQSVEGSGLLRRYDGDGTAAAQMRVLLGISPDSNASYVSHALVRVPEPATPLGFAALAFAALRRPARSASNG